VRETTARRLASATFAAVVALWLTALLLEWLTRDVGHQGSSVGDPDVDFLLTLLTGSILLLFPVSGLLIARRRPDNPIGWLLLAIGVGWAVLAGAVAWADYGLKLHPGSVPGADVGAALGGVLWAPPLGLAGIFLLLLFPDGHLPGRRWRWVAGIAAAAIVVITVAFALTPGAVDPSQFPGVENPLGVDAVEPVLNVLQLAAVALPLCMAAAAASLVVRFRRAGQTERLQIKWLAAAASVTALLFLLDFALSAIFAPASSDGEPAWLIIMDNVALYSVGLTPVAITVAVLRHRLYEIDVLIRRTLVYAALTVSLVALYLSAVAVLGALLRAITGSSGTVAVTLSTLAVAGAFHPVRSAIQRLVDRRFNRAGYDAQAAVDGFTDRLRGSIDLDALCNELQAVVTGTVEPTHASVWLRSSEPGGERLPATDLGQGARAAQGRLGGGEQRRDVGRIAERRQRLGELDL
jgi:hypothetical protein